ncbi:MAG: class I SAM-dependent methyltransferase [Lachnospiraceae bacterium]|nr:class I SAM-dependent methyltransferase [Lachnospiraceae bacterium]
MRNTVFPTVYGIDIRPWCKDLEEENIHIFIGSQEDREFLREVKKQIGQVDILIDDGGHTMSQQIVSLEEFFDLVKDDGIYLCEDCQTSYQESYGGAYKGETFIEYSKNLIDYLHSQYFETAECPKNMYSDHMKAVSFFENIVVIEKKEKAVDSLAVVMANN